MTEIYSAETRFEAWVQATKSVMQEDYMQNVILHIDSPEEESDISTKAIEGLNQLYDDVDMDPVHTVAEWIFPGWLYAREGIDGVYNNYPEQLESILENSQGYNWGTYFSRMIEREDPETGETFNPLKNLISKMEQANQPDGTSFHSCYELGFQSSSFDIPLYAPSSDRKQRRNLPCLSHLSFNLFEEDVHLTALYRSHDYRFKVPGNLVGLARLQACVANEVNAGIGKLVVHSTRASIDDNKPNMGEFRDFVNRLDREMNNQSLSEFI